MNRPSLLTVLSIVFFLCSPLAGATVSFTGIQVDASGTGFGNVFNLLSVQSPGNTTTEFGSVLWNGAADVETDDAKNTSETQSVTDLTTAGISTTAEFGINFNLNESGGSAPGTEVVLFDYTVRFQDASGTTLFDAIYAAPLGGLTLDQVSGGTGGAGWLFDVQMSPAEEALFFGASSNRVGMLIESSDAIAGTSGGAENFFIIDVSEPQWSALLLCCCVGLLRHRY